MIKLLSQLAAQIIFILPVISLIIIIVDRLVRRKVNEKLVVSTILYSQAMSFIALSFIWFYFLIDGSSPINFFKVELLNFGEQSITIRFLIDHLSLPFISINVLLGAIVGIFASRYLHRDSGYFRFFVLYHFFLFGMNLIVLAGNLTGVFIGWEIVGLTSALLIAFFAFRKQTVTNSLRAFWAYRVTDTGLLLASLIVLNLGALSFSELKLIQQPMMINLILILCLVSAMGKSAQFPFGHWLPKAMEGPTPSSAIFYGGLSVHAGVYLILRITDSIGQPLWFSVLLVLVGLTTVLYGSILAKIQSDAKSSLAFSAMTQVGIIFIELGFGWTMIVIVHFVGHALLRTYQLLNAASLLHDHQAFQHSIGQYQPKKNSPGNTIWTKIYPYVFWENYSSFSDKWSVLNLLEKASSALRFFDYKCHDILFQLFEKTYHYFLRFKINR